MNRTRNPTPPHPAPHAAAWLLVGISLILFIILAIIIPSRGGLP